MKNNQPSVDTLPAVISAGLFFLVTGDTAAAHLLTDEDVTRFYDGVAIAENCRDVESAMQQVIRDTFRVKDVRAALRAPSYEALVFYMDHYDGPACNAVRSLAARYLLGVPWHTPAEGGTPDRMPEHPKLPQGPHNAQTPEIDWGEVEAMAIESMQR